MATTGELRAIMQELHMVDLGDAASYLGEEVTVEEELPAPVQSTLITENTHLAACDCLTCQLIEA